MQHGTIVIPVALVDHGRSVFLFVGFGPCAVGQPGAFGNPLTIELSGLRDSKKALRDAGAEGFVDDAEIERHRNRIGFIGIGIEKLAIQHDGNRNDARLAFVRDLHQAERARAVIDVLALLMLNQFLREERLRGDGEKCGRGADDGKKPYAI